MLKLESPAITSFVTSSKPGSISSVKCKPPPRQKKKKKRKKKKNTIKFYLKCKLCRMENLQNFHLWLLLDQMSPTAPFTQLYFTKKKAKDK